ncbi:Copia protein [Cyphomyrmex costatus]|uniref:Copia protein n=1 Tax=Cyphomyrmex costatus TaxID=456900 RepID=A0A151IL83_9HYME|nr:Copia protein [Cyphomyrmex costatus]
MNLKNENNDTIKVRIDDVLYAPQVGGSLLSVRKLTEKGFKINFVGDKCEIRSGDGMKQYAVADLHGSLYRLRQLQSINTAQTKQRKCAHEWHKILGHRDIEIVKKLPNSGLVNGIEVTECRESCKEKSVCAICMKGKMTRIKFPKETNSRAKNVLDLIHSDVCGPMPTTTPSGKRYVLTFVDDCSRYTVIYLLREKSDYFSVARCAY